MIYLRQMGKAPLAAFPFGQYKVLPKVRQHPAQVQGDINRVVRNILLREAMSYIRLST